MIDLLNYVNGFACIGIFLLLFFNTEKCEHKLPVVCQIAGYMLACGSAVSVAGMVTGVSDAKISETLINIVLFGALIHAQGNIAKLLTPATYTEGD